jgi:ABC-2 type transport system ATP-binding protein
LGPNGAGKTTTIQMICGLLKPDSGQVLLNGRPLTGREARRIVGLCPQEVIVWERLTCMEQLQFVGRMYGLNRIEVGRRGAALLDELGLTEKRDRQARTLSGGMQRRLNLALALIHDPELIVLDEPEAGLDPQSRVKVREFIQALAQTKTVILTTHNMDEAERLADRAAIIDHGELLAVDTPQALKARLGEGDVLEIGLNGLVDNDRLQSALANVDKRIHLLAHGGTLTLSGLGLVRLLPRILEALSQAGVQPGELRLRSNTLEDVFIQLTGRKLRE